MRTKQTEGELSYQDVANILWSVCFLSINSPRLARRLACALGPRALVLSDSLEYGNEHPSQMHQFFVSCRVQAAACCAAHADTHTHMMFMTKRARWSVFKAHGVHTASGLTCCLGSRRWCGIDLQVFVMKTRPYHAKILVTKSRQMLSDRLYHWISK